MIFPFKIFISNILNGILSTYKTSFPIHSNQILVFGKNIILFWCGCFGIFCLSVRLSVCPLIICAYVSAWLSVHGMRSSVWQDLAESWRNLAFLLIYLIFRRFWSAVTVIFLNIFTQNKFQMILIKPNKITNQMKAFLITLWSNWKAKEREFAEKLAWRHIMTSLWRHLLIK